MLQSIRECFLGLIFLKYLSDKFEERYQEFAAEGEGRVYLDEDLMD